MTWLYGSVEAQRSIPWTGLWVKRSGISTWLGQCVVFLGKTLYSPSAYFHPGAYNRNRGLSGEPWWNVKGVTYGLLFIFLMHKWFFICECWLYFLCSRLSWCDLASGKGFSLEYPSISLHAISRDTSQFPQECIYCMMDSPLDGMCRQKKNKNTCLTLLSVAAESIG